MALTTGTASALIGGLSRRLPKPKVVEVEILRGVFISGTAYAPGDRVELPNYEANHMIEIGKAKKFVPISAQEDPATGEHVIECKRMGRKVKPRGDTDGAD